MMAADFYGRRKIHHYIAQQISGLTVSAPAPVVVLLVGWAATGKSSLAGNIIASLSGLGITANCISTDSFLIPRAERKRKGITGYNPAALDSATLLQTLHLAKTHQEFSVRSYDPEHGVALGDAQVCQAAQVLLIEGVQAFYRDLLTHAHLKIALTAAQTEMIPMRIAANLNKSRLDPTEASKAVGLELAEFNQFIAPHLPLADIRLTVKRDYQYCLA